MNDARGLTVEEDNTIFDAMNEIAGGLATEPVEFQFGVGDDGVHEIHMHFIDDWIHGYSIKPEFTLVGEGCTYKQALGDICLRVFTVSQINQKWTI